MNSRSQRERPILWYSHSSMKIYTRTGDKGETGLFGGTRVSKSALRMHAYGTIDELNALLGVIVSAKTLPTKTGDELKKVQALLFQIGADLATPLSSSANIKRMDEKEALELEHWIDAMEKDLAPLTSFIFPSGSDVGSNLHVARTVCRRAERWIVALGESEAITKAVIVYINRLSDYLFVAARWVNHTLGEPERMVEIPRA